eukprot:1016670-Pyramimonas_sp.AAC.1
MAFLEGLACQELAEAIGEKGRVACFALPPGSATVRRALPGFEHYAESKYCLRRLKSGTGTKDAPRAFSLKLSRTTRGIGLRPTPRGEELNDEQQLAYGRTC